MTTAPNFGNSEYPGAGEKIGPAWQAAWDLLAPGGWLTSTELIEAMMVRSEVVKITCQNLLRRARRVGLIEVRHTKRPDGGAGPAEYRIKL